MTVRGWVVRHRRLAEAVLMLGAFLLLRSERLYGQRGYVPIAPVQREVIATAVAVTPTTPAAPAAPPAPAAYSPPSPPGAIQPVSYEEVSQPSQPTPMLPPTALLGGMTGNPQVKTSAMPAETTGGTPIQSVSMLSVDVVGPDRLLLGQPMVCEIVIRNKGGSPITEAHVEQPLPAAVRVRKTEPPALARDYRLIWDLRHLEAGSERRLKIEMDPGRPGELDLRPYVTFLIGNGLRTQVIRPPFSIEISADHPTVTRGEHIRFRIVVANHGDAPVHNIKIYDTLPSGLHHPSGPKIGIEHFGDLLPGETRTLPLETTAVESGSFHNEILAQADRGVEAKAAVDGVITEPNLLLRLDGPTKTVTLQEMDFHLEVANPASLTAKKVRLVQTLPPSFEVVSASSGAALDAGRHALVWSLPDLETGQRQRVMFRVKSNAAGDWPMSADVLSQNFPKAHVNNTLHAEATALLKLDVRVREERLSVGEETVFRIHVFNKGDAPCDGVRLTATLPEAVALLEAQGPSDGQVEKQQIRFTPLTHLDAYGDVVYLLRVRGRQEGQGSLRVVLTAETQAPAEREISIQVQKEPPSSTDATAVGHTNSNASEALR